MADKVGVAGSLVSAMSCSMCFPAMASIGAVIGLGFLARWESVFVHVLIPAFVLLALLANALGWLSHRQWRRSALGCIGPLVALIGWLAFVGGWLPTDDARGVLYAGLVVMLLAAIWDLVSPASRRCAVDGAGKRD
ncbi:MAG: organomercurial transporter MerC [Rhodanobacter sp.]|nr:MAG: organomercurial transporter MerC [Rhodanobacter sp.]TAM08024.1 MAG: organomercurial transporter MerC [Rhodanobacter sp.]TAM37010.1 MAG: organomercurial transporter MerC [Rhodanobacter sp.]